MGDIYDMGEWLVTDDACARLRVKRMQLWRIADKGLIRVNMIGRTPLYYLPDILAYRNKPATRPNSQSINPLEYDDMSQEDY